MSGAPPSFDVVIPTAGRPSLERLLAALDAAHEPLPERVVVVDDRRRPRGPLALGGVEPSLGERLRVVEGPRRGPAAARNAGWRSGESEWVAFLDDDVEPAPGWMTALVGDLTGLPQRVAGSQGGIEVPLPRDRRPTDWERNTAALEGARWATADLAYRRTALAEVGGFDERFERAYREDADLGLRLRRRGYEIVCGRRRVVHPVRPADRWVSLRLQAGNADDVLMRALHGRAWRERAGAPRGRLRRHLLTTGAALAGLGGVAAGLPGLALLGLGGWLAGTGELAWARIAPGPRTRQEVAAMLVTSALMPPVAAGWWLRGMVRAPRLLRDSARAPCAEPVSEGGTSVPAEPAPPRRSSPPAAVLLDRDGTLIQDVPYNGDPERVRPMPTAGPALARLREAGVRLAVISNQSGVGRSLIAVEQVHAVNRRVEELLGPLGPWLMCPHAPDEGCECRKPAPALVLRAAKLLGVGPERCAVVGDIGADVEAARAAGARPVLVPTPRTRQEEIAAAPETAPDLESAVDLLLGTAPERLPVRSSIAGSGEAA